MIPEQKSIVAIIARKIEVGITGSEMYWEIYKILEEESRNQPSIRPKISMFKKYIFYQNKSFTKIKYFFYLVQFLIPSRSCMVVASNENIHDKTQS